MNKNLKDKALGLIKKFDVTAYEIEKHTHLSAVGVQKIIDGATKKPQEPTLNAIISYITKQYEDLEGGTSKSVDGILIDDEKLYNQKVYIIPVSGRGDLYNSFYSDEFMDNELQIEEMEVREPHSKYSKYFKIEVDGVSMDDGTRRGLCEGDWIYCRSLEKIYWRSKLHTHKWNKWVFFHGERGIIIKSIKEQNLETGELVLESFNPDKKRFPDFKIKLSECSFVCNIVRVQYDESDI